MVTGRADGARIRDRRGRQSSSTGRRSAALGRALPPPASRTPSLEEEIGAALAGRLAGCRRRMEETTARAGFPGGIRPLSSRAGSSGNRRTEDGFEKALALLRGGDPSRSRIRARLRGYFRCVHVSGRVRTPPARGRFPRAREAAEKALSFGSFADAHSSLASVLHRWVWDFPAAEAEFRRALTENLRPCHRPHHWFAPLPPQRWDGSKRRARRSNGRVCSIRCLSSSARTGATGCSVTERTPRRSSSSARCSRWTSGFAPARFDLGITLARRGVFEDAVSEIRRGIALAGEKPRPSPRSPGPRDRGTRAGSRRPARRARRCPRVLPSARPRRLAQPDEAFAELERAFARREDALRVAARQPARGSPARRPAFRRSARPRRPSGPGERLTGAARSRIPTWTSSESKVRRVSREACASPAPRTPRFPRVRRRASHRRPDPSLERPEGRRPPHDGQAPFPHRRPCPPGGQRRGDRGGD